MHGVRWLECDREDFPVSETADPVILTRVEVAVSHSIGGQCSRVAVRTPITASLSPRYLAQPRAGARAGGLLASVRRYRTFQAVSGSCQTGDLSTVGCRDDLTLSYIRFPHSR